MIKNKAIAIILTAAAGDGTKEVYTGVVTEHEKNQLEYLSSQYPAYIETAVHNSPGNNFNLVDAVLWWICSGDDLLLERVSKLSIEEFCELQEIKKILWA